MTNNFNDKPLIIAHRGESFLAPENTIAAIELAWENGDDAVEIDVRLTSDNKIAVIHDATTKRTGNANARIRKTPLKILKEIDVGIFKGEKWRAERIPTLEEILIALPPQKILVVEIKSGKNIIEHIVKLFNKIKPAEKSVKFIGFNLKTLKLLKGQLPKYECFLLYQMKFPFFIKSIESLIKLVRKANLDGLDLYYKTLKTKADVEKIKNSGLELFVWTVNDPNAAKKLVEWGVDGITTDKAQWLREKLEGNV